MLDFSAELLEAQREAMVAIATALTAQKEAPTAKKYPQSTTRRGQHLLPPSSCPKMLV
jgi:hypothetical protein